MIIRRKHSGNFAVIPNSTANDGTLKADALGVLVYLIAKPSDWVVNTADLRKRFRLSRNRVYDVLNELVQSRYVRRIQRRDGGKNRFTSVEYHVFDCPDGGSEAEKPSGETKPIPDIREADEPQQVPASPFTAIRLPVTRETESILNTDYTKTPSEGVSVSDETAADAPSVSGRVWQEGRDLLSRSASKAPPSIIGKWLKQATSCEAKEKLLAMIRAAAKAGTGDPVSYITAALNREYPPPPDPKSFDRARWEINRQAAIRKQAWSEAWGPKPGARGCLMPSELIDAELTRALSSKRTIA